MNNKYIIRLTHPLIRPGLEIETEASEKYVVAVTKTLLDKAREINAASPPRSAGYSPARREQVSQTIETFASFVYQPPPTRAIFELAKDSGVTFELTCAYPNAWHRFWQRMFFGFVWRRP